MSKNNNVNHVDMKMSCDPTQFPTLKFCGTLSKPHGVRDLRKHYHLHLDPKMGLGTYAIRQIPSAHLVCTVMLISIAHFQHNM